MNIDWLRIGETAIAVVVLWVLLSWASRMLDRWSLRRDADIRERQRYLDRVTGRD
jgi:hypothetical protein